MKKGLIIGFLSGVITTLLVLFIYCLILSTSWFYYDIEPLPVPDMPVPNGVEYAMM